MGLIEDSKVPVYCGTAQVEWKDAREAKRAKREAE
jgi:hypothetical protein